MQESDRGVTELSLSWRLKTLLIALSVLLMSLGFAPVSQFYLCWIGLIPLFVVARDCKSAGRAMFWGWVGGVLFFLVNMWWLSYVTWAGMFVLVAYLALFWGFAAAFAKWFRLFDRQSPFGSAVLMGCGWTGFEWVRGSYSMFGPHGLPWLYLGDTQTPWLAVCQIADVTGVYGVTFLIVMINALLTMAVVHRHQWKRLRLSIVGGALLLVVTLGYGQWRLHQQSTVAGPQVLVVQPNYPQSLTGSKGGSGEEIAAFHMKTSAEALADCRRREIAVDLVVWSETMMPSLNPEDRRWAKGMQYGDMLQQTADNISRLAEQYHTSFLVGGTYEDKRVWEKQADGTMFPIPADHRNSAYLFDSDGQQSATRYDKIQLLPFGEFIPFRDSIPWLYRWLVSLGPPDMKSYELTAGSSDALTVFTIAAVNRSRRPVRFVAPICFEDIVSPLVTDLMRPRNGEAGKRADLIVNITNDGWFKAGERAQHLQAAIFRSIENRVPTARSVNTGISGFIDSVGRTSNLVTANTAGWNVQRVMLDDRVAIHTAIGELFAYLCAAVAGGAIAVATVVRIRSRFRPAVTVGRSTDNE